MALALISSLLISSTGWSPLVSTEATESELGFDSVAPNYDYHATGFNPQTQITRGNVKFLELKWLFPWPDSEGIKGITPRIGSISQPLIVDGIVYGRTENLRIFAIDAKTGEKIWDYQPLNSLVNIERAQETLPLNVIFAPSLSSHAHSFSYYQGRIYAPWPNCQVFGIDAKTGLLEYRLETPTCKDLEGNLGLVKGLQSVGPVFDGRNRVLIYGTGGREAVEGGRGAFRGYSLDTGRLLWTFYLMPPQDTGDPEWTLRVADKGWIRGIRASELPEEILMNDWGKCPEECGFGKGDIGIGWGQWAVDEETGIAYLGTGNPSPSWNATYRPGPNVFSSSVIALKTDTGELVWWHQVIPHDLGDLDCSWNTALATIEGRKIVFKECKGAQLYAFDASTGEEIWSTDYSPHVKRGAPGPSPNHDLLLDAGSQADMVKPWVSYPGNEPNWRKQAGGSESDVAVAYGKVFSTTFHFWFLQRITSVEPSLRNSWGRVVLPSTLLEANATVWAHDALSGEMEWRYDIEEAGIRGGVTVSGGLVWFTTNDGTIRALDADNGSLLWERQQGSQSAVQPVLGADSEGKIKVFTLVGSGGVLGRDQPAPGALLAYGLPDPLPEPEVIEVERVVEVPIEIIRIREVPVEVEVLVPGETVVVDTVGPLSLALIGSAALLGFFIGVLLTRRRART